MNLIEATFFFEFRLLEGAANHTLLAQSSRKNGSPKKLPRHFLLLLLFLLLFPQCHHHDSATADTLSVLVSRPSELLKPSERARLHVNSYTCPSRLPSPLRPFAAAWRPPTGFSTAATRMLLLPGPLGFVCCYTNPPLTDYCLPASMRNYVENRGVENEKLPCAESTLCGKAKRVLVYVCKFFFGGGGRGIQRWIQKRLQIFRSILRETRSCC